MPVPACLAVSQFLKEESEERGVTIIYATHIFDGLEHWASDIVYIREGLCQGDRPNLDMEIAKMHHDAAYPVLLVLLDDGLRVPLLLCVR